MTLAGENEKMPCVLLQFEGRVTEEAAMVGLDGTTATKQTWSARAGRGAAPRREHRGPRLAQGWGCHKNKTQHASGLATLWITGKRFCVGLSLPIEQPHFVLIFVLGANKMALGPILGQFVVAIGTPSLWGHPSFYPVAHITEHPSNAHTRLCSEYESA